MRIVKHPAKYFRKTRKAAIDTIVIHYISAVNINKQRAFDTLEILKFFDKPVYAGIDKKTGKKKYVKISYHYLISRKGEIYGLVDENNVAYHAGISSLNGRSIRSSCNDFSIAIALVGGNWCEFTEKQYELLIESTKDIRLRRNIPKDNIVGHQHISPGRRVDPGSFFNWGKYFDGVFEKGKDVKTKNVDFKEKTFKNDLEVLSKAKIEPKNNIENGKDKNLLDKILEKIFIIFNKAKNKEHELFWWRKK